VLLGSTCVAQALLACSPVFSTGFLLDASRPPVGVWVPPPPPPPRSAGNHPHLPPHCVFSDMHLFSVSDYRRRIFHLLRSRRKRFPLSSATQDPTTFPSLRTPRPTLNFCAIRQGPNFFIILRFCNRVTLVRRTYVLRAFVPFNLPSRIEVAYLMRFVLCLCTTFCLSWRLPP